MEDEINAYFIKLYNYAISCSINDYSSDCFLVKLGKSGELHVALKHFEALEEYEKCQRLLKIIRLIKIIFRYENK